MYFLACLHCPYVLSSLAAYVLLKKKDKHLFYNVNLDYIHAFLSSVLKLRSSYLYFRRYMAFEESSYLILMDISNLFSPCEYKVLNTSV